MAEIESGYSSKIALIYLFNLIVGIGALTLPKAFAQTGWILGIVALTVLALMSYCTSSYMIEAMSIGNAMLNLKNQQKNREDEEIADGLVASSTELDPSEDNDLIINSDEDIDDTDDLYAIKRKVEMGELARLFFNKAGLIAYYVVIALYLYGDLAIYAAAVPKSLTQVICGGGNTAFDDHSQACGNVQSVSVFDMYRITLLVFTACLCPFTFFNLAKTKFLQIATTILRWLAFTIMVILALMKVGRSESKHHATIFNINQLPNFFGVAVYSFMCQHSLPSIITPVKNKKKVHTVVFLDFIAVSSFYALLVLTAVFAFSTSELADLYTLSFVDHIPDVLKYFLELFPVFTLTTNFPIISITLRENLKTLFLKEEKQYGLFVRRFLFPLLTVVPPILIAFITYDVGLLVSITGSYAGAIIQYVIPVMLVYFGRKCIKDRVGLYRNKHRSPFRHVFWIYLIMLWYLICLVFVTVNNVLIHS